MIPIEQIPNKKKKNAFPKLTSKFSPVFPLILIPNSAAIFISGNIIPTYKNTTIVTVINLTYK